jgi:hypothetical protein
MLLLGAFGCVPMQIFFRGFGSTVYRTDAELPVKGVSDKQDYKIGEGLVYSLKNEEDGKLYIKVLPNVKLESVTSKKIVISDDENEDAVSGKLYEVEKASLKDYNKIWQQGLSWSTLVLPIKYRPSVKFNGTEYERVFSTDLSVGPFIGYKFKVGNDYNKFMQVGGFAGPTLIQFPDEVKPNNGTNENITNDNLFGFTYGYGAALQIQSLQIGLIRGKDMLGGQRAKEWPYDGKQWWSFAIGFKFLNN